MYFSPGKTVPFNRAAQDAMMRANYVKCGVYKKYNTQSTDHFYPSTKQDGLEISCRVYVPLDVREDELLPLLVWYHGGGFCMMTKDERGMDLLCQKLCGKNRVVMLSISYRLAPEHPFPAAVHDCMDALKWVGSKPEALKHVDYTKGIVVAGDSAGGNFACVMSSLVRDGLDSDLTLLQVPVPRISQQILVYPVLFTRLDADKVATAGRSSFLPTPMLQWYVKSYAPDLDESKDVSERRMAPGVAGYEKMPPTIFFSAGNDLLRFDSFTAHEQMLQAGVESTHHHIPHVPHGFLTFHFLPSSAEGIKTISKSLRFE